MELIDKLILPQSSHHIELLRYFIVITLFLLLPYLGIITGNFLLSVIFKNKSKQESFYTIIAKQIVDFITFNKSISFALGVIPFLSLLFTYAQLLNNSGTVAILGLIISFLFFLISLVFIYSYKYSFHISDLLNKSALTEQDDLLLNTLNDYKNKSQSTVKYSAFWALTFISLAVIFLIGSFNIILEPSSWKGDYSILDIVLSIKTVFGFLTFISFSFLLSSFSILFYYFKYENKPKLNENISEYLKGFSLSLGIISLVFFAIFLTIQIIIKPVSSLSSVYFGFSVSAFVLIFLILNLFYIMNKERHLNFLSLSGFFIILLTIVFIIKEQTSFNTVTTSHSLKLIAEYEQYEKELKEEMGISVDVINGIDIYNGKCIACHQFEQRLVGPPYNSVLPKYEGKRDDLIKFILNPVKVNPEYTSMPNQGLKPKEAEAIADYLIQTYNSQK